MSDIPVVILCGGQGTRLREETEFKPKPMVEIGGRPILWHLMKIYDHFGHKHFVLPLGYKGEVIKEYFMDYDWRNNDFRISLKDKKISFDHDAKEDWVIDLVDTGQKAMTGLRLYRVKKYLEKHEMFMLTYGDGVANIDLDALLAFHREKGKLVTITGLHPISKYGVFDVDENQLVNEFKEKPILDDYINGGFMVMNRGVLDYITEENTMLVDSLLPMLAKQGEVALYKHQGFWHCMDTYRDFVKLNDMWKTGAQWKIWGDDHDVYDYQHEKGQLTASKKEETSHITK